MNKIKEQDIQKACLDYLGYTGWFAFKINNGGIYDEKRKIFRTIKTKGISDIIAVKYIVTVNNSITLFIETKKKGKKQTDDQIEFEENITDKKGHYILAYSVDDIEKYIVHHFNEKSLLL